MKKYNWGGVPKEVKAIATDIDGNVYGYEGDFTPYIILDQMWVGGNYLKLELKHFEGDWKHSLELRPN